MFHLRFSHIYKIFLYICFTKLQYQYIATNNWKQFDISLWFFFEAFLLLGAAATYSELIYLLDLSWVLFLILITTRWGGALVKSLGSK